MPADLLRSDLIDRDADSNAGSISLERMRSRQKAGQRASMIAGAIPQGFRIVLGQAGKDEQIVLVRLQ